MSDTLFAPPDQAWQRLSPKYLTLKIISICITWSLLGIAATFAAFKFGSNGVGYATAIASVLIFGWRLWRAPRVFRSWGYAERDTDVYVTNGIFIRELKCVPYGRMQLVQVQAGPIARLLGLATVEMVTASSQGSVIIPGLTQADAQALRDRLVERGETLQAGI